MVSTDSVEKPAKVVGRDTSVHSCSGPVTTDPSTDSSTKPGIQSASVVSATTSRLKRRARSSPLVFWGYTNGSWSGGVETTTRAEPPTTRVDT